MRNREENGIILVRRHPIDHVDLFFPWFAHCIVKGLRATMSEEMKKTATVSKVPAATQGQPVAAELKDADLEEIAGGSKVTVGNRAGNGKGV